MSEIDKERIAALHVRLSTLKDVTNYSMPLQLAAAAVRADLDAPIDQALGLETHILNLLHDAELELKDALIPVHDEWNRELKASLRG